jgi:hypothetical protein
MSRSKSASYLTEYRAKRRDRATGSSGMQVRRAGNEPEEGSTVTLMATTHGHRQGFALVADGWRIEFATRRDAMDLARQCLFVLRASILDRDATTNSFSGSSPGEVKS